MPFGGPPRPIGTSLEDAAKNRRNTQPAPAERAWEPFKGAAEWREVRLQQALPVEKTAVIICDMWDKH
jgi:hypothetical protein